MNNRQRKFAFVAAILFQLVVMAGVWVNGFYPLWLGEEVRLKTRPVDPRDLFRGNYRMSDGEVCAYRCNNLLALTWRAKKEKTRDYGVNSVVSCNNTSSICQPHISSCCEACSD